MRVLWVLLVIAILLVAAACQSPQRSSATSGNSQNSPPPPQAITDLLPGMPPYLDPSNVYGAAAAGALSERVKGHRELVYVPNTISNDVWVIDPKTYTVVDRFPGGPEPQHVVPEYDLGTLYVGADHVPSGGITPIDPTTGKPRRLIPVQDVYNLYFTPDGRSAIVVAEYYRRLDFYDPKTWRKQASLSFPDCEGINHMDFSADGRTALIACEFANRMVVLDVAHRRHVRSVDLKAVSHGMPQDTRLAPDGKRFYVADMHAGGVYVFDGAVTRQLGFIPTGDGAHGTYFSRDGKRMFVTNRGEGSVSVLDPATGRIRTKWRIPGGGSPDMGGLSPDGSQLWLSGRYHDEVYVLDSRDGRLIKRIKVGRGPHGLLYWPQPGRYSLGHTANIR
jgi:YVTN family beta-propeller protein